MKRASRLALKEWAVVVRAVGEGRQSILLRKGGIADEAGAFRLKEQEFFLYPTFEHQVAALLRPDRADDIPLSVEQRPAPGKVLLDTYVEAIDSRVITSEAEAAGFLAGSIWSIDYVRQRLAYKPEKPLLLVTVRAHRLWRPHLIKETPAQAGCVSWVPLDAPLSTGPSTPVALSRPLE